MVSERENVSFQSQNKNLIIIMFHVFTYFNTALSAENSSLSDIGWSTVVKVFVFVLAPGASLEWDI